MQNLTEHDAPSISGFVILLPVIVLGIVLFIAQPLMLPVLGILLFIMVTGFTIVQPNEAKVVTFFGKYIGTLRENGFLCTLPLTSKETIPLKLVNFLTDHLKVNDLNGNPIEIGAVVVWRVTNAAQAMFNVDDYRNFVANQSDIAIRAIAAHYPYDTDDGASLRGNVDEIAAELRGILQDKLAAAGIVIEETRLTHLAYAPEIAMAMLKRQQSVAIFQARQYMVHNALSIIDDVMEHFEKKGSLKISDDKKAELINSLLVVMTSDKESSPVLNVGR